MLLRHFCAHFIYIRFVRTGESADLYNGVTDFSSYKIAAAPKAGELPDNKLYNGVTDFSSYKTGAAPKAEGLDKELYNGVTDFSGKSYNDFEIEALVR